MKKRIIASLVILAVFGLVIATYAYTSTTNTVSAKASCCKSADSCPLKAKMGHAMAGEHAGESCPMKAAGMATAGSHNGCDCCGDSCPMKQGSEAKATAASSVETAEDCCDNCDCCSGKAETAV